MKTKDRRSIFREPKCATCDHWQVVHKGPRHLGVCVAISCPCPKFAFSGMVSSPHSAPEEGIAGASAVDPDEASPVDADSPATTVPFPNPSPSASASGRPSLAPRQNAMTRRGGATT